MKSFMIGLKHLKTTLAGIASILAGLGLFGAGLQHFLDNGEVKTETFAAGAGAISVGFGLIFAKDADKSNAPTPGPVVKAGLALLILCFAAPTFAQTQEPQAPAIRWSLTFGKVTFAPAVSTVPLMLSLPAIRDGSFKTTLGPNIGGGLDITAPNGYGGAIHLLRRDTGDGAKPLITVAAIIPALEEWHVRPVASYQKGGGAAPWQDGLSIGLSGAANFGFTGG